MDRNTIRVLRQAQRHQAAVQQSRTQTALKAIAEFKAHCINLCTLANKAGKPVAALSEFERLGVMFGANCPVEYDGEKFRYQAIFSDMDENGVVDGRYHVQAAAPPLYDGAPITPTKEPPCQA